MAYEWSFGFLWEYRWLIAKGLGVTVAFTVFTNLAGLIIGLAVGLIRSGRGRLIHLPLIAYIEIFRCTPMLVQLVWFYYALPVIIGINMPATVAAGLTLSLYAGAFYSEIFRGGIVSIEKGQWDAARSVGLRPWPAMRLVILPQAVRRMIPPIMNQTILQLKNTSLISTVAVADLLYQGATITAATYRPLEVYTLIAVLYFAVLFPLTSLVQRVECHFSRGR